MSDIPSMSRKDFKFIADLINTFEPPFPEDELVRLTRIALANHFANSLRYTNGMFQRDKFYRVATDEKA